MNKMTEGADSVLPKFHENIVYVDESGDHGPTSSEYPVFVLAFCVFDKEHYAEAVTTAVQKLKFRYFGNDTVVLHERDIRKRISPFNILRRKDVCDRFMDDLNHLVVQANFTLVAAAIRKDKYNGSDDIYHLAMKFGLERLAQHCRLTQDSPTLHVVCESRGKQEDDKLELAFRRICQGRNWHGANMPCDVVFAGKERCHAGMELADLIARPIGRHVLMPSQRNRAWDILRTKFRLSPSGEIEGFGLKIFP